MSIKKKLMDAVVAGFGAAAGSELFRETSKAVAKHALKKRLGVDDDEDEDEKDEDEKDEDEKPVDPKVAERERKRAEKEAKRAAEEKKRAAEKAEKEIDAELAALKKRLKG